MLRGEEKPFGSEALARGVRRRGNLTCPGKVTESPDGEIALVTGGSSGIGLAIARGCARTATSSRSAARRPEKLEAAARRARRARGGRGRGERGGLRPARRGPPRAPRRARRAREQGGRRDRRVRSRSCPRSTATCSWTSTCAVLFLVTQAAMPLLRQARGQMVNLASIAGTHPDPGLAGYGATKAAVISLTQVAERRSRGNGVRVTALCPGFVDTPMAEWTGHRARRDDPARGLRGGRPHMPAPQPAARASRRS